MQSSHSPRCSTEGTQKRSSISRGRLVQVYELTEPHFQFAGRVLYVPKERKQRQSESYACGLEQCGSIG